MNFSAKLKTPQQPNYIFNFNIDIPIKYKPSITQRSNPVSPGKSPAKLNAKKYKLSSITPRPTGVSANVVNNNKKSSTKSGKKSTKIPKTMKEQFLEKDLYQINNFNFFSQQRKPQTSISRKTQKIISNKKSLCQQQICPSRRTVKNPHSSNTYSNNEITPNTVRNNVVRNISILQKLITNDNNIDYRTNSSQMRNNSTVMLGKYDDSNFVTKLAIKQQQLRLQKQNQFQQLLQKVQTANDEFDLTEIREFQEISTHRKERLNYEYLKSKILIQASVRKIQRAWRNYRTKKLVNCYSQTISKKILKNQLLTSARSQSHGLKISKHKSFGSNQLYSQRNQIHPLKNQHNLQFQKQSSQSELSENQQEFISRQDRPFSKKVTHAKGKPQKKFFEQEKFQKKQFSKTISMRSSSPKIPQNKSKKSQQKKQKQSITSIKVEQQTQIKSKKSTEYEKQMEQKLKKFRQQEIRKWDSILDSIRKGKNIQVLLQKSQKYKRQLQNNFKIQYLAAINQNRASPILFKSNSSKTSLVSNSNIGILTKQILPKNIQIQESPEVQSFEKQNSPQNHKITQEDHNETEEKRRQKIMFFQNEILKIDNEEYSDMSSVSCQSFTKFCAKNSHEDIEERQRQENMRLRKKLQLFNTHFLDISSADQGLTDRSLKGLKGNSTDQRRNTINRRFIQESIKQNVQVQDSLSGKEQLSSEQTRLNRRPDSKIITNQTKSSNPLSKIEELINRKIQYPEEEQQSSSAQSSLIEAEKTQNLPSHQNQFNEFSDSSSNGEIQSYMNYKKLNDPQLLYGDPALTHRDKKKIVPGLELQNINRKIVKQGNSNNLQPMFRKQTQKQRIEIIVNKENNKKQQLQVNQTQKSLPRQKVQIDKTLKICTSLEEELMYESLLEFSDSNRIVDSIKGLFESYKKDKKVIYELIQEGQTRRYMHKLIIDQGFPIKLCWVYFLQHLHFILENKLTDSIEKSLWTPCGPKPKDLLRYLRKDSQFDSDDNQYIMNIDIFEKHWKYANANIYFDRKYNDNKTEQQRVNYLKGLTRVYFRSIYDAFNQSLEFQRVYGLTGKPYPWSTKICRQDKKTLKVAFQQAYRRILKISVVYYGVHFDEKSKLFNEEDIKELQQERLLTLLMMQLEEQEYRWSFIEDQVAEIEYDIGSQVEKLLLNEFLEEFLGIGQRQFL